MTDVPVISGLSEPPEEPRLPELVTEANWDTWLETVARTAEAPPSKRGRAYGPPSGHGWKLGNDGGAETTMEPSVLGEFFARHPSASGGSRAGGYYQIICDACGALVPVVAPDAAARRIDIRCADCGWEEHLVEAAAAD